MSKRQIIVNLKPPFTLNKDQDNADRSRPVGSFETLTNYIPKDDIIETREGISLFVHTPETTSTTPPYDPSSDPTCIIWSRFESSTETEDDDIQGINFWTVTANGTQDATYSSVTTEYREGVGGLYIDGVTLPGVGLNQGFYATEATLSAINFPGMTTGKHNYIIAFWYRRHVAVAGDLVFNRYEATLSGGFELDTPNRVGGGQAFVSRVTNSANTTRTISSSNSINTYTWYHLAMWCSENVGNSGLVIYNASTENEETLTASPALVHGGKYTDPLQRFTFGVSRTSGGKIFLDDLIVCVGDYDNEITILNKIRSMRDVRRLTIRNNDFSGDSDVVILYNFENNMNEEISSYNLTENGSPAYSIDSKEDIYSTDLEEGDDDYGSIDDSLLGSEVPGKGGEAPTSFSICGWFKAESLYARQGIVSKYDNTGGAKSFSVTLETSGKLRMGIGHTGGTGGTNIDNPNILSVNNWYHFAITYTTGIPFAVKFRIHHEDGTLIGGSNYTGNSAAEFSPTASPLEIGRHNITNANSFDGRIDEVVIFKRALSDADIDKIFNGTFGS